MPSNLFSSPLFCLCSLILPAFVFAETPEWNQFRGPNHDNKSTTTGIATVLANGWPEGGPKLLWKVDHLGAGYGNISFYGDKVYALGDVGEECMLIAMKRETGEKIWSKPIGAAGEVGRYFGPRSTPAVDGEFVFAYGQFGDFVCFDANDGTEIWGGNVADELGGKYMNNWGFSSSPIFDGELVLLPIGGQGGTVVAFRKNGQRAWRTEEIKDDAPYGSVVPVTILGKKQYLLFSMSGIFGINPEDGKVLWHGVKEANRAICSDPVVWEDYVMGAMAYNVGSTGFRASPRRSGIAKKSRSHAPRIRRRLPAGSAPPGASARTTSRAENADMGRDARAKASGFPDLREPPAAAAKAGWPPAVLPVCQEEAVTDVRRIFRRDAGVFRGVVV